MVFKCDKIYYSKDLYDIIDFFFKIIYIVNVRHFKTLKLNYIFLDIGYLLQEQQ